MLFLVHAALGAPLGPTGLLQRGLEVSAYTGSERAWLRERGCTGTTCEAWARDTTVGGEIGVALAAPVGLYLHGAWLGETVDAALYAADGYTVGGGARASVSIRPLLGVHAWVGIEHQLTAGDDLSERLSMWQLDGGVLLRAGRTDEGIQGWIGVGAVPWSDQHASVLDGDIALSLAPALPVEGQAGFVLLSEPLLGPWDDRTRIGAGVRGTLGYRTGLTGFVTFLH